MDVSRTKRKLHQIVVVWQMHDLNSGVIEGTPNRKLIGQDCQCKSQSSKAGAGANILSKYLDAGFARRLEVLGIIMNNVLYLGYIWLYLLYLATYGYFANSQVTSSSPCRVISYNKAGRALHFCDRARTKSPTGRRRPQHSCIHVSAEFHPNTGAVPGPSGRC
jgi:hypothetical protein